MPETMTFGIPLEGVTYTQTPAAYAAVFGNNGRIAAVQGPPGFVGLAGGGYLLDPANAIHEFLVAVNNPHAPLHVCLGGEALAALAYRLKRNGRCSRSCWSMIHRICG